MRLTLTVLFALIAITQLSAQQTAKPTVGIYGFVRGDASFDTRRNVVANEGLLLLYPLDRELDTKGADLNAVAAAGFYTFNSRLGVNLSGMSVLNAALTGRIEADFAGFSGTFGANSSVLRIRQAYIQMGWKHSSLVVGQAWHPMVGPVQPDVISLAAGAPFNPFNRSPQVRYDYAIGAVTLSAAALWQFQFTSQGPEGKTTRYQREALLPEFYLGVNYTANGLTLGLGSDCLTIKPANRVTYTNSNNTFADKADGTVTSFSGSVWAKYTGERFSVSAKSILGQNLSHLTIPGGYALVAISDMLRCDYTNYTHTTSWLGATYGKKYKAGLFGGFSKSLGTGKQIDADFGQGYGEALRIDRLYRAAATLSYNIPNFMFGMEYEMTGAAYGDTASFDFRKGRYDTSHNVINHRVVAVVTYSF